jgi:hypothetical protein
LNTAPHYRVTSDGRTVEVAIDDLAVLQGTVVEGPSFQARPILLMKDSEATLQ